MASFGPFAGLATAAIAALLGFEEINSPALNSNGTLPHQQQHQQQQKTTSSSSSDSSSGQSQQISPSCSSRALNTLMVQTSMKKDTESGGSGSIRPYNTNGSCSSRARRQSSSTPLLAPELDGIHCFETLVCHH